MSMRKEVKNLGGNTFLELEYNPVNKWLYANWIGYQTPENIKTGIAAAGELRKKYNYTKILNDNRSLIGPWDMANEWLFDTWAPEATSHGIKYIAHLISTGLLGQFSIQSLRTRLSNQIEIKLFEDPDKAKEWLQAK